MKRTMALKYSVFISIVVLIMLQSGCEEPTFETNYHSVIVVDGWIENGEFARVLLTRTTPFFTIVDSSSYLDLVETFASISVTNSRETEFLTLTTDNTLFPRHVYKTTSMRGEIGETYTLRVKLYDTILTATTTITAPPVIDSLWFEPLPDNDTLGSLKLQFTDDALDKNYYRIQVKTGNDSRFNPIMTSTIDDADLTKPSNVWPVLKGGITRIDDAEELYFKKGENVTVKICSIEKEVFEFWRNYQIESLNATNPFASSGNNLKGNIEGEGVGIWSGEGSVYKSIRIE